MFIDSRTLDDGKRFDRGICIVGAGAAGIALAIELERAGFDVDLIESGGFDLEAETESLSFARFIRDSVERTVGIQRLRQFGGTTNHWGGNCHPLEPFDFEAHSWVPDSGWPITREELDPHYDRAREILGLPHPDYRYDPAAVGVGGRPTLLRSGSGGESGGDAGSRFKIVQWRRTQPGPARFGEQYREWVEKSERVRCFLYANVTEIVPDRGGARIERLRATTLSGRKLEFRARRYVLCCGAIENARLLLMSNSVVPEGVGNQSDMVGRYFSQHAFRKARLTIVGQEKPRVFQEEHFTKVKTDADGRGDRVGYATTPEFRRDNQMLGFSAIINPTWGYQQSLVLSRWSAKAVAELEAAGGEKPQIAKPEARTRKLSIAFIPEQSPNRESRIRLATEKDALGNPMAWADLQTRDIDLRSRMDWLEE